MDIQTVQLGQVTWLLAGSAVRGLFVDGEEVLRGLEFLVRDAGWDTLAPETLSQTLQADSQSVHISSVQRVQTATGELTTTLQLHLTAEKLTAEASSQVRGELLTNRTGFVLLHPAQHAGLPFEARHSEGASQGHFPELISPVQTAYDLRELAYTTAQGTALRIRFDSLDAFEMEDQRNWSDGSFKTYYRPLALPMPYQITGDFTQRIEVGFQASPLQSESVTARWQPTKSSPLLGLALSERTHLTPELLQLAHKFQPQRLHVWLDLRVQGWQRLLSAAKTVLDAVPEAILNLEVVLPEKAEAESLRALAQQLPDFAGELTALPEAYLLSYQPDGVWPAGMNPAEALELARSHFPGASLGSGSLTYFTEYNRCPPAPQADFVTHGTSALIHSADDRSVMQTLEALPAVFASARKLAPGKPYVVAPSFIGMRSNPYGAPPRANLERQKCPLAELDPRHSELFGAAWALGYMVQAMRGGVDGLTLAELGGPFGVADERGLFPLFHVLRGLRAEMTQTAQTWFTPQLVGVQFKGSGYLANPTGQPQPVPTGLPLQAHFALLDGSSLPAARRNQGFLDQTIQGHCPAELPPYALLRWEAE